MSFWALRKSFSSLLVSAQGIHTYLLGNAEEIHRKAFPLAGLTAPLIFWGETDVCLLA